MFHISFWWLGFDYNSCLSGTETIENMSNLYNKLSGYQLILQSHLNWFFLTSSLKKNI